jgi:hypothetical protein
MVEYKDYIAGLFVGRRIHATCDCILRVDVTGEVVGYEIYHDEIIYKISTGSRVVSIGENTKGLKIEFC